MQTAQPLSGSPPTKSNRGAAWLVHLYTASGALAAFFGTLAVVDSRYRDAFLWMAYSTFVDSTDGLFARAADVKRVLPGFDGARLDDIVDYLTFVFLPMFLLEHSGSLPQGWGAALRDLPRLEALPGVVHVEPEMVGRRAAR